MNGLKALETIGGIEFYELERHCEDVKTHCEYEYNTIKRELNVLQILKENKVDLDLIDYWMTRTTTPEELLYKYNDRAFDWAGDLTTEEMTQIVEWLKGE